MGDVPSVQLHDRASTVQLSLDDPTSEVPERVIAIRIHAHMRSVVTVDDEPLTTLWSDDGKYGYAQLDLTNRVGHHRIVVETTGRSYKFDFRTVTAKATFAELQAMAQAVVANCFAFERQFIYALPSDEIRTVELPQFDFGWFRERLSEIHKLVELVDIRPATESRSIRRVDHSGRNTSVPETLKLLRERKELLEEDAAGPLVIYGRSYWPSAVVSRTSRREPVRLEHVQIASFLNTIAAHLAKLRSQVPPSAQKTLRQLAQTLAATRARAIVRRFDVSSPRVAWSPAPTFVQRTDGRYRRLRQLQHEFTRKLESSSANPDSVRVNIKDAWEIFQSFVAHMTGLALGLSYVSQDGNLRKRSARGFSMHSDSYELFYDIEPPPDVVRSWRSASSRPASERPDIVLFERQTGRVAMLDAKFSTADGQQAREEHLAEMQAYMNSFGLSAGAIVFPGKTPKPAIIEAMGLRLVELPLRAEFFADPASSLSDLSQALSTLFVKPEGLP